MDDSNLEGDHTFTVDLDGGTITPNLMAGFGSPMSTTVTIQDPEGMLSLPSKMDIRVMHIKHAVGPGYEASALDTGVQVTRNQY